MQESDIQRKIITAIKAAYGDYCDITNNHGAAMSKAGTPDMTVCIHGLSVYLEVKVPEHIVNGRIVKATQPTVLQGKRLEKLRKAGAIAGVVYSVSDALDFCKRAFLKSAGA